MKEKNIEIRIEPLQECYLDQVCALEEEMFSMPWHRESFQEMIEDKNACYLVALHQEEVVGACGLRNIVGDGEVTNVVTKKAYQNRGIGATLLNQLFSIGRTMGVEAYTLEVRVSNRPAIHLYQKLGFKEEGIRKNFYEKPREDALIMWKR